MKILYGVVGAGMGHAIRSSVVLEHLVSQGHDVHVVASGRAVDFLSEKFGDVTKIWGLEIGMKDNEVSKLLTATKNLQGAVKGLPGNIRQFFEVESEFDPDVVISDFETWSWFFGKLFRRPIICIDNIQIINRCWHDESIVAGDWDEFNLTKQIVKARAPRANWYLVTTFFYPEVKKKRTELVPPILRQSILDATPTDDGHILVYQTAEAFADLPKVLQKLDRPSYVYGLRRDIDEPVTDGNITYKPFSNEGFVADLASAHAVCASAGFTLCGEAVHLGKPYLATPVRGQFEQSLNARYIHELGYGTYDQRLDRSTFDNFLERHGEYAENLQGYDRQDNGTLFGRVDELLDQVAAGLMKPRA